MGAREDQLDDVGGGHEQQQAPHHELQRLLAAGLQHQDPPGDHGGDAGPFQQGDAEQQLEADRSADELGEIGGHGDDLGLHPIGPDCGPGQTITNVFRQVLASDDTELGREGLHQHGHQIGPHHYPQQLIAEGGAGLDIGRKIARVDITDGGDEGGAEQGQLEFAGRDGRGERRLHTVILRGDMRRVWI